MSQASLGVSSSPSVATSYVTDDGTAVPAANTLNVLGDDTTDDNINGIQTTGSGDTVTIELTNRFYGTTTTSGAVTSDIITFGLSATQAAYAVWFECIGIDDATGDTSRYTLRNTFKTDGAAASVVNTGFNDFDEDASLAASEAELLASGNNFILRVTGVAGVNMTWTAVGSYLRVA